MKTAFLSLDGLPAADVKQIEVFLRFAGRSANFAWVSTAADICDLQFQCASPADAISAPKLAGDGQPAMRCWILDRGQQAPDADAPVLRRPLQIDGFEALLRTRESQIASSRTPLARSAPAPQAAATAAFADEARHTYRLARWPGSDLLRGKPKYVRMLGFLSNRPLSLARLKMLSGVDEATCRDLLRALDQRGLLLRGEIEQDVRSSLFADTVPSGDVAVAAVSALARPRDATNSGLFSRLRKRLGLI